MQPGQAGGRQQQQNQQAVWQAQQQADQQRYMQRARQRQKQKQKQKQAQYPPPFVPENQQGPSASGPPVIVPARTGMTRLAKWMIAAALVLWVIAVGTHIEWVRQHDGVITPVSYVFPVLVSVLAAVLLLAPYLLRRRPRTTIAGPDSVDSQRQRSGGLGAGGNDEWWRAPGGGTGASARPAGTHGENPRRVAEQADGGPVLLVLSGSGPHRRIGIPPGGLVVGRSDRLGLPFSADDQVSREHLSVRRLTDGSVEVADLGSTNGTYLNASRLAAPARIAAGDVLRLGRIELGLETTGARSPSDTAVSPLDETSVTETGSAGNPGADRSFEFYLPEAGDDDRPDDRT